MGIISTYTYAEIEAVTLLYGKYYTGDIHEAADKIILLAEKIKASRATAAMQPSVITNTMTPKYIDGEGNPVW